jgi:hypothetical protein
MTAVPDDTTAATGTDDAADAAPLSLIYCATFSHDVAETHSDAILFDSSVVVRAVRIIADGVTVSTAASGDNDTATAAAAAGGDSSAAGATFTGYVCSTFSRSLA